MRQLHKLDFRILLVMFLQVSNELLCIACVYGSGHPLLTFCQHSQYTVVHEIVYQHDSVLCTTYQL